MITLRNTVGKQDELNFYINKYKRDFCLGNLIIRDERESDYFTRTVGIGRKLWIELILFV